MKQLNNWILTLHYANCGTDYLLSSLGDCRPARYDATYEGRALLVKAREEFDANASPISHSRSYSRMLPTSRLSLILFFCLFGEAYIIVLPQAQILTRLYMKIFTYLTSLLVLAGTCSALLAFPGAEGQPSATLSFNLRLTPPA